MNLSTLARKRAADYGPVRVGLIGASKFESMFLAQVPFMEGLAVSALADLHSLRVKAACRATVRVRRDVERAFASTAMIGA